MKQILFLCKGELDKAVPIINIAQVLNKNGNLIELICSNISRELKEELEKSGIKIFPLGLDEPAFKNPLINFVEKLYHWVAFRRKARNLLYQKTPDLLYIATADTAIVLRGIFSKYKYILHLRELHDKQPHYMKLIKKPAQQAYKVVVPEENRAYLYYNFLNLREIPTVIPNKPFYHPMQPKMDIAFLEPKIQHIIKSKKNIIYQGHICKERCLNELIKASLRLKEFNIILMGKDYGLIDEYRKINPEIIHLPFIRPPLHLNITSWAYIGIITYNLNSLNTIYCAPNKLWEFTGFSIPILGNLNLGIKYSVGQAKAGVTVNFENVEEIIQGINYILNKHTQFQINARDFFDTFSYEGISL